MATHEEFRQFTVSCRNGLDDVTVLGQCIDRA